MISSFSGDAFLATRAARKRLAELRSEALEVTELAEDLTPGRVQAVAGQAGLFGAGALYLDFDAAFSGKAGVKPRNDMLKLLGTLSGDTEVIVVDSSATEARQKQWRALGEHVHLPTPRFSALQRWVADELRAADISFRSDVPAVMVELFGEDLPGIASEITKLSLLDSELDENNLRELTGKAGVTDAFALIDAIVAGNQARALEQCRALERQAEEPVKVMAAISWQFGLVARCTGLLQAEPRASDSQVASTLKVAPFVAKKVRGIARKLDEQALLPLLSSIADAELAAKTGRSPDWALEKLSVELSGQFAG